MQRRKYKQQMLESDRHTDIQTGSTGILRDRLCRWDNERKDLTSLPLRVSWFIEKICFLFLSKNLFFFTVKRWASYFWRRKEIIVFKMENRHCSLNGHVLQTVCPCCQPCVWTLLFSLAVNRSHGSCSLLFSAQSRDLPKVKHDDSSTLRSFRCSSLVFPIVDNDLAIFPPTRQLHGYIN